MKPIILKKGEYNKTKNGNIQNLSSNVVISRRFINTLIEILDGSIAVYVSKKYNPNHND